MSIMGIFKTLDASIMGEKIMKTRLGRQNVKINYFTQNTVVEIEQKQYLRLLRTIMKNNKQPQTELFVFIVMTFNDHFLRIL